MNTQKLRQMWQAGQTAVNAWLTIPGAWTAEIMAQVGFDVMTIDMQHGLADYQTTVAMLQVLNATEIPTIVRVPWNEPAMIMRIMDAGADGIICPMVNNPAEAQTFVGATRYPPLGYRSYGPIRSNLLHGSAYYQHANTHIFSIAMIETQKAVDNLEAILATEGLDGIYIGTIDLSISMDLEDLGNLQNPKLRATVESIIQTAQHMGRFVGIHAMKSPDDPKILTDLGAHIITPVNDSPLLGKSAAELLTRVRRAIE